MTRTRPRDGGAGRLALVVDDVVSTRLIVGTWLRREGFEVFEASSANEAEEHLGTMVPDIIVLDVNLPDRSGLDLCEDIKSAPDTSSVPVLHISATATEARDRVAGLDSGADGYLVEPLERQVFVSTVFALLRYADARRRAERLAGRLSALHRATLEVNAATSHGELLTAAGRGAASISGADAAVVVIGRERAYVVTGRPGPEPALWRELRHKSSLRLLALEGQGEHVELPRLPEARGTVAVVGSGPPSGPPAALLLLDPEAVSAEGDKELVAGFANVVVRASEKLEDFERTNEMTLMLQRALLPERLPALTGLDLAARYTASAEHAEVGGDFYEVLELADGLVGAAIGDVQGHSLRAAVMMAEIRYALRAYALLGPTPAEVVGQLNDMMLRLHPDVVASVCYLLVEPSTGRLEYSNAGHIPPLLVEPAGAVRTLEAVRPLLGVPFPDTATSADVLPAGGTLVLVTDGVVERRTRDLQSGLDRLARLCADHAADSLEHLADRILSDIGPANPSDDIAVLLLRRSPGEVPVYSAGEAGVSVTRRTGNA